MDRRLGCEKMADKGNRLNIIFMAHAHYPHGMAMTRRLQNSIDYLKGCDGVEVRVLVLRQGRVRLADSEPCGVHKGIEYVTIGGDIRSGMSALIKGPKYFIDGMAYIRNNRRKDHKNALYVFGYPSTDNIPMLIGARLLGYKMVFDIVEDIAYLKSATDVFARLRYFSQRVFFGTLRVFADAVLVVSKHLEQRVTRIAKGHFDVINYPISVNFDNFSFSPQPFHDPVRFFYGGTFGEKDGVENLIAGFEGLCSRHDNVNLVLTGKGDSRRMDAILNIIAASAHRERILYKGYLPDEDFYRELNASDVLCMTRTSSAFADTGFPFKLGEYLATGRPVIASDVSDVSRYLTDGENALLIEPDSAPAIARAMEQLLTDRGKAQDIGIAGRAVAKENFDSKVLGERLRKLLIDL